TAPILVLSNVQPAQAGTYSVVVRNIRGSITSAPPALLTVNLAPVLTAPGNKTVNEGSLLTFTNLATDRDVPAQGLTFALGPGAPDGAGVDPGSGLFTWTPNEAQGPGSYPVTIRVTDDGVPPMSDAKTFTITVNEVNTAPVLAPIEDQTIYER